MEKIRNNQPFEGELSIGTINNAGAGPSKSHHHHKRAALNSPTGAPGGSQRQPGTKIGGAAHHKKGAAPIPAVESQPQPGVFGTAEILQRQQAQQLEMPINTNSTISSGLSAGAPIMATAPAGTFRYILAIISNVNEKKFLHFSFNVKINKLFSHLVIFRPVNPLFCCTIRLLAQWKFLPIRWHNPYQRQQNCMEDNIIIKFIIRIFHNNRQLTR